jgi:NAD(P)-dependent dehydrogenase (short-subunit alcohol dehydrogenase family)
MKLHQQNAVITGGTQGLGQAIVREFLAEGANVLLCSRNGAEAASLAAELSKELPAGQKVVGVAADVSSEEEVKRLFDAATEELGELHILVNNAGIYGPKGPSEEVGWEAWKRAMEINLYGTMLPCRAVIPLFKASGRGKIVNLSGGGATNPLPRLSAYAASKAAVVRLTETLAVELAPHHIDVNAVAPGALNTRLLDEVLEAGPEVVGASFYEKAQQQAQKGGVPLEKGARLCVYLASRDSDGVTGKLISAQWDPWDTLHERLGEISGNDIYTLRRIVPADRGLSWGG